MVSESRRDTSSAEGGPSWVQPGFIAPEHVEATVRLLYDVANRTGRYQIEVSNPTTKELMAMRSCPFTVDLTWDDVMAAAYHWLREASTTLGLGDPF